MNQVVQSVDFTTSGLKVNLAVCHYAGFSLRETGAAPAVVRIRAGSSTGRFLELINLPADGAAGDWYGPNPIDAPGGIYVEIVSGAVEGSVRYM